MFGSGGSQTKLTAAGSGDMFAAKYDANGVLFWAVRAGSPVAERLFDRRSSVILDSHGGVIVIR